MSSKHPLDVARATLIQRAPRGKRPTLAAHLDEVRLTRERESQAENNTLVTAHAAKGVHGNSFAMQARFEGATRHAEVARDTALKACMSLGVKDDQAIEVFIRTDTEHFLKAFAQSQFATQGTYGTGFAQSCFAIATSLGARVKNLVVIARHQHNETLPPVVERLTKWAARIPFISIPLAALPWLLGIVEAGLKAFELLKKLWP